MTSRRLAVAARCVAGGGLVAFSMPPWGWWPCAFVGLAILDHLIAVPSRWHRFRRASLFALAWLMPATLWMWALTPPGYLVVGPLIAATLGGLVALVPHGPGRRPSLVAVVVVWELVRWSVPFGGVPLATLAMSQVGGPLLPTVRVFGPLLLVALTVTVAMGLSGLAQRQPAVAGLAAGVVILAVALAAVAPRAEVVGTLDVALVQGGGEQGTRAIDTDPDDVFDRHLEASELVELPVDVVIWPENAIDTPDLLENTAKWPVLTDLARRLDAVLVVGVTEDISDTAFVNSQVAISPEGDSLDRYEKRIRVPFGEFVPFRSFIEPLAPDYLPRRDAAEGRTDAVLTTPVGDLGVAVSWEIFFARRAVAAVDDGAQILANPTNGSSYWLTIVQTQQVASSQLRALETDRYVLQASPTGFTAIITPDGDVLDRTAVSERAVVQGTVELREGKTWAVAFGPWPMLGIAVVLVAIGEGLRRRDRRPRPRG